MKGIDNIYIIGAGAIGKALAVFLKHEGKAVVLLRGSIDNIAAYTDEIQIELSNGQIISESIQVSAIGNFKSLDGAVVLTNKSFGNAQLVEKLKGKTNSSPILLLQNGLNIEKPFIDHGFSQVYRAVLFASSQPISENLIRFKSIATSAIGTVKGNLLELNAIVQQLANPYFDFKVEEHLEPVLWKKVIVNSVFNSVCPLLETDNGIFHRSVAALNIAKRVIAECINIVACKGIYLDADEVLKTLLMISTSSDGQFISTYQDIRNRRRTEIETLNVAIAGIAHDLEKDDMVKETRLLGELVDIKSRLTLQGEWGGAA